MFASHPSEQEYKDLSSLQSNRQFFSQGWGPQNTLCMMLPPSSPGLELNSRSWGMGTQGRVWNLRLLPAGGRWGSSALGWGILSLLPLGKSQGGEGASGALLPRGLRSEQQGAPRVQPSRAIGSLLPENKSEVWGLLWNLGGDEMVGHERYELKSVFGSEMVQKHVPPTPRDKVTRFPLPWPISLGQRSWVEVIVAPPR